MTSKIHPTYVITLPHKDRKEYTTHHIYYIKCVTFIFLYFFPMASRARPFHCQSSLVGCSRQG